MQPIMEERDFEIVRTILREAAPGRRVWAFGSRATGRRMKRYSDLDLLFDGRLTPDESADLEDAFDESVLPFKVDRVESGVITPEFRERIEPDLVLVQAGSASVRS